MDIIVCHQQTYFLVPIQKPMLGWRVRSGTFRVSAPYDRRLLPPEAEQSASHSRRKKIRKLMQEENTLDSENERKLIQWISLQFQAALNQPGAVKLIHDMGTDMFYGAGSLESESSHLDFVLLQPTLQLLKSGFSDMSINPVIDFDELHLCQRSQSIDLGDIYETLVVNTQPAAVVINVIAENKPKYLVPPRSAFIISDLDKIHGLLSIAQKRGGFDMIIMDPPWQNASVDRLSRYNTLDLYDLFKIPISGLLRNDDLAGARASPVVAVWITNRRKVRRFVVEKLFPAWGLKLVARWYWLKITTQGEPVLDLSNTHRKAYEGILIGRRVCPQDSLGKNDANPGNELELPLAFLEDNISEMNKRLVVSVPGQHSRKPTLGTLLRKEFFKGADYTINQLELFARNLEEGVVSWGNEPLRYQYCGRDTTSGPKYDGYLHPC
ncbi:N(6)-adenine-specific DNA methyltransferase [Entomortierella parvispora]|uniref:N(6)-adenine-specific DNA methyltransferase n=1 Tax=Entomortierella parvispora TaxID=205924 RepID=A0A9P3HGI5_9FUNG|nr:N(6)-adenine-specific DNA methyltransferase [Entomortierella parvispora]